MYTVLVLNLALRVLNTKLLKINNSGGLQVYQ